MPDRIQHWVCGYDPRTDELREEHLLSISESKLREFVDPDPDDPQMAYSYAVSREQAKLLVESSGTSFQDCSRDLDWFVECDLLRESDAATEEGERQT